MSLIIIISGKKFTLWQKLERDERTDVDMTGRNTYEPDGPKTSVSTSNESDSLDYNNNNNKNNNNNNNDDNEMLILLSAQYIKEDENVNVTILQVLNLPIYDRKGRVDNPYIRYEIIHINKT